MQRIRLEKSGLLGIAAVFFLIICGFARGEESVMPSSRIPEQHMQQYSDLAVQWMQEYLRVDTTNPPGNEMRAVGFYKKILDNEGIENRVFEIAPGRGDLWARIPAGVGGIDSHVSQQQRDVGHPTPVNSPRPIILLNHM